MMNPPTLSQRRSRHRMSLVPVFLLVIAVTVVGCGATATLRKVFDLPAGPAERTLRLFAQQSGEQIVYLSEDVRGVRTHKVRATLTCREALEAMLVRSGLVVLQDEQTGGFALRRSGRKVKPTTVIERTRAIRRTVGQPVAPPCSCPCL